MEQAKVDRINELARIAKQRELSEGEKNEREALRREYIAEWRRSAEAILDSTYIMDKDGNKTKIKKKTDK